MSRFRVSLFALALLAVAPSVGVAQTREPKQFEDSWFWGIKGGGFLYSTTIVSNAIAPSAGAEWLITRTRAALYVSYDHTFLSRPATVFDPLSVSGSHDVQVNNMHRITVAGIAMPKKFKLARPYVGVGFAVHVMSEATPNSMYSSNSEQVLVESEVDEQRSQASPILLVGVQSNSPRYALFAQMTAAPLRNFFLADGGLYSLEIGLRYNVGTAIEKIR